MIVVTLIGWSFIFLISVVVLAGQMSSEVQTKFDIAVLQRTSGSGPYGESSDANFYVLRSHPEELTVSDNYNSLPPCVRTNLPIDNNQDEDHAFVISNLISRQHCKVMIEIAEQSGFSRFAPAIRTPPGMRKNRAAHWFAGKETVAKFMRPVYERFKNLLPKYLEHDEDLVRPGSSKWEWKLMNEMSHRVANYKYIAEEDDEFTRHTDGEWPGQSPRCDKNGELVLDKGDMSVKVWGADEGKEIVSKYSLLLYLNDEKDVDVSEKRRYQLKGGGATFLFDSSAGTGRIPGRSNPNEPRHRVFPQTGSAVFFRHGFGPKSVFHAGEKLKGGVKYVVRWQVVYEKVKKRRKDL